MSSRSSGVRVADGLTKVRAWSAGIAACAGCDWMASSQVPWFRMQACIQRWMRARLTSVAIGRDLFQFLSLGALSLAVSLSFQCFCMHYFKAGNIGVPFEQGGDAAHALIGVPVQIPDNVDHVIVVRIENVRA